MLTTPATCVAVHSDTIRNTTLNFRKRKLTAVCSHQTRIGNLDAHLI